MIVFSDTTPIIALCSIQRLELMQQLFARIHVVTEVIEECMAGGPIVVPDLRRLDWIEVVESTAVVHPGVLLELDETWS
jgi:predicted nucleic acid-binding protein